MLKDANLSGKFLELPSSETTAYQQEQQSKGKSINTETDIQEEDIKKIRNRTMRTKEKASNLNELTEITGSRIDNNGVLEEYKNGIFFQFLQIKKGGMIWFELYDRYTCAHTCPIVSVF